MNSYGVLQNIATLGLIFKNKVNLITNTIKSVVCHRLTNNIDQVT